MNDHVRSSAEVLSGLRDFQRTTSRYAFSRLFHSDAPSLRFLVADEVGLGKTLVARGVIAQTVEHFRKSGDERVDIVYICSNGAIARQNVRKLNIAGDEAIIKADRLTMLLSEVHRLEKRSFNIVAVTPGTSLDFGRSSGKFEERALLYALLQHIWGAKTMRGSGQERLFYLGIDDNRNARKRLRDQAATSVLSTSVIRKFKGQMRYYNQLRQEDGRPTFKVEFNRLVKVYARKGTWSQQDNNRRDGFIAELRRALAIVGIAELKPALVILDEFQRFRDLLDPANQTWSTQLAFDLFNFQAPRSGRQTRTLLLSATPYRPYTTADDIDGDSHFEDFVRTAQFLLDDELAAGHLRFDLRALRQSLLSVDRDGGDAAAAACRRVEDRLRPVMARTERLASTLDRNGMLETVNVPMTLERTDIDGYLAVSNAADLVGQRDVVEFWKSGPYLLNFMEGYALKNSFEEATSDVHVSRDLVELVKAGRGFLNWNDVSSYGRIDPANARLRALVTDTIGRGIWKLLWLPPALMYYKSDGIFESQAARSFTKRLVFSAWNLVPKVISAMLSYEAERAIFAGADETDLRPYDEFSFRPDRRLDFTIKEGSVAGMPVFNLVVPYVELARLVDPLAIARSFEVSNEIPTRSMVEERAEQILSRALAPLIKGRKQDGLYDQRWYWAAPLLLDFAVDAHSTLNWWAQSARPETWTRNQTSLESDSGFFQHLQNARAMLENQEIRPLGRVPEDLIGVLVSTALGSPAVCALRSLSRISGGGIAWDHNLLASAARIGWGFRSLLNSPDATAIVRATTETDSYWRAALGYCVTGHLQAVLDEYLHVLKDWRGFLTSDAADSMRDLSETAYGALSLRTASYFADIPVVEDGGIRVDRRSMRGRFGIRFGDGGAEAEKQQQRTQQASEAFNSPFWPFVLSTTSVGQEGLDFHLYSHAVVHWNLPSNPIDLEQREGRVHRYKGHAIRKNVAKECGAAAFDSPLVDPWKAMFNAAANLVEDDGEIAPYWIFSPPGSCARIERYIPLLPYSSEVAKLERLLKAVATYRLSFGQPRQEELAQYLASRIPEEEKAEIFKRLRVDLTPREADLSTDK